jgi:DNA-binding HxlR family transcriptional regulator
LKPALKHETEDCRAVSDILARVGDKWTVLVVSYLSGGPMRFSELRRTIGNISQKMLTTTLRGLERDGFVTRTVTPSIPPRVDYELTDLGRELEVPVKALGEWARRNIGRINEARERFDADNGTYGGAPASRAVVAERRIA